MAEVTLQKYDEIVMKLLHYFITEEGYTPIILHGAENEIWLENLKKDHQIIRIVTNHIHNDEQLDFDIYRTKAIIKTIKQKTFSFNLNAISIFLNLGDSVNLNNYQDKHILSLNINTIKELDNNTTIKEEFPNLKIMYFPRGKVSSSNIKKEIGKLYSKKESSDNTTK